MQYTERITCNFFLEKKNGKLHQSVLVFFPICFVIFTIKIEWSVMIFTEQKWVEIDAIFARLQNEA